MNLIFLPVVKTQLGSDKFFKTQLGSDKFFKKKFLRTFVFDRKGYLT
jgi:hypothetical protein